MFNGLIKEIAGVASLSGGILRLRAKHAPKIGESIAVNGACLSVVKLHADGFSVQISSESLKCLAGFEKRVHIEPAMRLGDRIDGHLIQGHIDAIGEISKIIKLPVGHDFYVKIPPNIENLVAEKGSIAMDGVSLTINEVLKGQIRLTIIPLSMQDTLFASYQVGRQVNLETDLLARYAARILGLNSSPKSSKQPSLGARDTAANSSSNAASIENNLTWEQAEFYARIY